MLDQLFKPGFDPASSVLVDSGPPPNPATETTNSTPGTVRFVTYAPKDLVLKAEVSAPSVLLLNDHFDPGWKVLVDGQPAQLLRCNFLMSGVHVDPGTHLVEFRFQPPFGLLYVSLAAIACGLLTLGILVVTVNKKPAPLPTPAIRPPPPSPNRQTTPLPKPAPKPHNRRKSAPAPPVKR